MGNHTMTPLADKLTKMGDTLTPQIQKAFADRQTNTLKRQREARKAWNEGRQLERGQKAMSALADMHRYGPMVDLLADLKTKAEILSLAREKITHDGGYYDGGSCQGIPSQDTPQAHALWKLLDTDSNREEEAERQKAIDLQVELDKVKFAKIPGYFPTPPTLAEAMVADANIKPGMRILEPSAGSGNLLDQIPEGCEIVAYEQNHTLCGILELKGYPATCVDFMKVPIPHDLDDRFDRVLMNPPFECLQDIEHVRHAFDMLNPGGVLVAITSPAWKTQDNKKCTYFRNWLNSEPLIDLWETTDLAAGSFKESGTNVASVMLMICRV